LVLPLLVLLPPLLLVVPDEAPVANELLLSPPQALSASATADNATINPDLCMIFTCAVDRFAARPLARRAVN
jgi:hypothetical protein